MPMPVKKKFDSQAKTEQESQHNTTLYNGGREAVITYLNSPEAVEKVAKKLTILRETLWHGREPLTEKDVAKAILSALTEG